jgi:hypothetical protein
MLVKIKTAGIKEYLSPKNKIKRTANMFLLKISKLRIFITTNQIHLFSFIAMSSGGEKKQ